MQLSAPPRKMFCVLYLYNMQRHQIYLKNYLTSFHCVFLFSHIFLSFVQPCLLPVLGGGFHVKSDSCLKNIYFVSTLMLGPHLFEFAALFWFGYMLSISIVFCSQLNRATPQSIHTKSCLSVCLIWFQNQGVHSHLVCYRLSTWILQMPFCIPIGAFAI